MLEDQDCQVTAREAKCFVTALGEVFQYDEPAGCSTINVAMFARSLGREPEPEDYEAEFLRLQKMCLDEKEFAFVQKVTALQCVTEEEAFAGRFRVYGELSPDDNEKIVVVTEVKELAEDNAFWAEVERVVAATRAHFWDMDVRREYDKSWRVDDSGQMIPDTLKYGRNHGKIMVQSELSWQVQDLSPDQLRAFLVRLSAATDSLWQQAGVGVC
jgi:hypothetical protein